MKVICAWCEKVIRDGEVVDGQVSHGICDDCRHQDDEKVNKELKTILIEIDQSKRKLENLLYPVSDIEIFALNTPERVWVFSEGNH